jgi:hypothetical protein
VSLGAACKRDSLQANDAGLTVDSLLVAATSTEHARARRSPVARWLAALVILGYFLAAIGITWRLWTSPAHMVPTTFGGTINADVNLSAWYMRYVATALSHGHLPALVTTALNSPQGVNAMWNTSLLAPAVLLTPVTLIAGPTASLTVLLTLGFAGSATTMYVVLRRWQASVGAAALGGTLYAFLPALTVAAQDHYHLQFAVLPPLIVDAMLRLVTGRGRPVGTGLWLGLLVVLQVFCAEELLVDTALAGAVLIVILLLTRLRDPRAIVPRLKPAAAGFGCALLVTLVLAGPALWVQLHGPLAEHGSPWDVYRYGYPASSFVTAPSAVLIHGNFAQYLYSAGLRPIETFNFLGWPLLAAMVLIPFACWRDLRIRVVGLSFLLLELMTLGGQSQKLAGSGTIPASLLPWHWLQGLPIFNQLIVVRLSILADGMAAVVLALVADRIIAAVRSADGRRQQVLAAAAIAALAAILVPLIPRPVPAATDPGPPRGWSAVISRLHLPAGAAVLVLPLKPAASMLWQAQTNEPISITGGYCIAPDKTGKATKCGTPPMLTRQQLTVVSRTGWLAYAPGEHPPSPDTMAAALRAWHPAAVVLTPAGYPRLTRFMLTFFGPPDASSADVLGWRTSPWWYRHLPAYLRTVNARVAAQQPRHHARRSITVAFACPPPSHMVCSP